MVLVRHLRLLVAINSHYWLYSMYVTSTLEQKYYGMCSINSWRKETFPMQDLWTPILLKKVTKIQIMIQRNPRNGTFETRNLLKMVNKSSWRRLPNARFVTPTLLKMVSHKFTKVQFMKERNLSNKCKICDIKFLLNHQLKVHKCSVRWLSNARFATTTYFVQNGQLKVHKDSFHERKKPFWCNN